MLLPGALITGLAEEITEPDQRRAAFRTLIKSLGVVGRLTLGDVRGKSDAEVDILAVAFPILAITPTAVRLGPFDPGGVGTRINTAIWVLLGASGCGRPGGRGVAPQARLIRAAPPRRRAPESTSSRATVWCCQVAAAYLGKVADP